jgi:hypothetical protein
VQDSLDAIAFQFPHADAGVVDVAVSIADDAKEHLRLIAEKSAAKNLLSRELPHRLNLAVRL